MSKIEWTDKTWNPVIGCSKISEGCENCYAEKMAFRLTNMLKNTKNHISNEINTSCIAYSSIIENGKWNGKTALRKDKLQEPSKWKKPCKIFVCDMGDLFHESVPFQWIDKIFTVCACNPHHIFQLLTKRPERALKYFNWKEPDWANEGMREDDGVKIPFKDWKWPLDNVWIGVTVENQEQSEIRIPLLSKIPVRIKYISCEPLLGPIDLSEIIYEGQKIYPLKFINWVIAGGESGPGSRPMHPDWVRSLQDQCEATNIPFFFKQWGEYRPFEKMSKPNFYIDSATNKINFIVDGKWLDYPLITNCMFLKIGKKKAGRLLDGIIYNEFPV